MRVSRFPIFVLALGVGPALVQPAALSHAQGAPASAPSRLVSRAVEAIGGAAALRRLGVTTLEFQSASFGLGQEETPESPPRATLTSGRISYDWQAGRRTVQQEARAVTGVVTRSRQVVVGEIGLAETGSAQSAANPAVVVNVRRDMRLQPHRLLLAALENPAALRALRARAFRGELMEGLRYAAGSDTVNLWFDRITGVLVVSEALADDDITGDRQTLTWYTRWQPVDGGGGVRLPRQVDTEVNGRLLSHNVATAYRVEATPDAALFTIPDSIIRRAVPFSQATPAPLAVSLVELAPGVWRAEGGSHHSLVVEQGNRLLVVELPQSRARGTAVLDTLRSRFPNRPVGSVVNTHHHHDHSGGIRVALARGLPVVTHGRNVGFVRGIGTARKTVMPDALSRTPRAPVVRGVADSLVVGTGDQRVILYPLPTIHAEGILAAYLPAARLLFVADVLSPTATLNPVGSAEVVAMVRARGLAVDRVVGAHSGIAAWADVERAAGVGSGSPGR